MSCDSPWRTQEDVALCPLAEPIDLNTHYRHKELRALNFLSCCVCSRKEASLDNLRVIRIKQSFYDKSTCVSFGMHDSKLLLLVGLLGRKTKLMTNLVLVFDLTKQKWVKSRLCAGLTPSPELAMNPLVCHALCTEQKKSFKDVRHPMEIFILFFYATNETTQYKREFLQEIWWIIFRRLILMASCPFLVFNVLTFCVTLDQSFRDAKHFFE